MDFLYTLRSQDNNRPSLFELVAQDELKQLLQPALKYVLSVLAQRNPRYLLRVVNRHEEFYALLMLYVESHYLRTQSASFAENFYGLRRRRAPLIETPRADLAAAGGLGTFKLRKKDIRWSLLFLVGIPYMRAKAHDYFEHLGGGVDTEVLGQSAQARRLATDQTISARLKRAYKATYPWGNAAFELWILIWNLAYLFDKTQFYRPWLAWIRVDLRRSTGDEALPVALASHVAPILSKIAKLNYLLRRSPYLLLDSLKIALPMAIFFVRFLEWWYSPSSPAQSLASAPSGPMIPPPVPLLPHPQGIAVDRTKYGICPICSNPLANATALPTGYAFCYRCIHAHIERTGQCPVTLMPAKVWQLRKLMM